jgi:hypothetical protein
MRGWILLSLFLLLSLTAFASPQDTTQPKTIEGCVLGINGGFRLNTANGETYLLKGHHSSMFNYNGKQVRITGTMKKSEKGSAGAPRTLQVTDIKKVYDTCQF